MMMIPALHVARSDAPPLISEQINSAGRPSTVERPPAACCLHIGQETAVPNRKQNKQLITVFSAPLPSRIASTLQIALSPSTPLPPGGGGAFKQQSGNEVCVGVWVDFASQIGAICKLFFPDPTHSTHHPS